MNIPKSTATPRFLDALSYAVQLHGEDVRKGTTIPYVAHLLNVCSLVFVDGGSEDEAIAALLHDALEDHPEQASRETVVNGSDTKFWLSWRPARIRQSTIRAAPNHRGEIGRLPILHTLSRETPGQDASHSLTNWTMPGQFSPTTDRSVISFGHDSTRERKINSGSTAPSLRHSGRPAPWGFSSTNWKML